MAKRYGHLRRDVSKMYELVQLLRLNDFNVELLPEQLYYVRKRGNKWIPRAMTGAEVRAMYGPGTTAYELLLRHPRAGTIIKCKEHKHKDLA